MFPLFQHAGIEILYMLSGVMEYGYGRQRYKMKRGDTLQFEGDIPHGPTMLTKLPIRFLSITIYAGLQGQTTPGERSSGKSEGGYNCNLELVGQFQGEGAYSQDGPAFLTNCAYFATENRSGLKHAGVVVLDVSDPQHLQPTAYLDDTPAGRNPHETLKVNEARKLLAVAENNGPNFAVYDLSADCRHPALKSSITLPGSQAHMGGWAPDGKTYCVGQNNRGIGATMSVVDVTDPSNAKLLLT